MKHKKIKPRLVVCADQVPDCAVLNPECPHLKPHPEQQGCNARAGAAEHTFCGLVGKRTECHPNH